MDEKATMGQSLRNMEDEETIDLMELARLLWAHAVQIVAAAVAAALICLLVCVFALTPKYQASINMIVNTRQDNSSTFTSDNFNSAKNLISTYAVIIKGNTVLNEVIDKLDLDMTYTELYKMVDVADVDSTQIMQITVTDTDAERAGEIAQTIADIVPDVLVEKVEAGSCKAVSDVIIDPNKVFPQTKKYVVLAGLLGAVVVCGVLVLAHLLHDTIVDDEDVQKKLGLPVLGLIPRCKTMWNLFNKKNKTDGEHRTLQLITDKGMPFGYVEAYKSLRTNLDFMAGSMDVHTLVITSTVPEESKSNVAVNLALTLAESGKKVALVDCDLRKPVLHRYLKAGHNVKGVSNVLSNQCTLDEALHELKEMNLTFLPAGTPPPNPSEMLSQPQMQAMVDTLRQKFDFVILDAPPVSVVTDAAVIGRYVDGAVFVVRSDYAPADAVRGAVKKLQDAGVRVLGSVLTRYDMKKALKGSSYAYSYAYNYNYAYEKQKADVTE